MHTDLELLLLKEHAEEGVDDGLRLLSHRGVVVGGNPIAI
jgi:hypothetical protein